MTLSVCFSACHSVAKSVNLGHNFLTVGDTDSIFGMYTQLMKRFQMTPRLISLHLDRVLYTTNSQFWTLLPGAMVFHKHTRFIYLAMVPFLLTFYVPTLGSRTQRMTSLASPCGHVVTGDLSIVRNEQS